MFIILNYEFSYIKASYIIHCRVYCIMYLRLKIMPYLIYEGGNVGDAILLPNFRYRTMNLAKSTLIIIVMHVNMFYV